ncbi:hypothetical protein [Spiroplasma endosymbiont of Stenodema calcarata]|uniref:hypothetical protein n=1 Tax=Spiroplasma endosymbiont of Stenodema calcarata TaxID=3139328 RepID=UPI003CCB6E5E
MGITIKFNIKYEVKFKDLQQRDEINGSVIICNDFEALSGIQKDLEKYFKDFVNNLFKKQNYEIVDISNLDFNKVFANNTIWVVIREALKEKGILFKSHPGWHNKLYNWTSISKSFSKWASVLSWAGEGYDPEKLTVAKFLEFYKRNYFKASVQKDYYVKGIYDSFQADGFTIENLPFNDNDKMKSLSTPIKVLLPKDFIDERLNQFAETTVKLWHYYQLETYNDKLIFKMTQTDYDRILKATDSFSPGKTSLANLRPVFETILKIFNETVDSEITYDWGTFFHRVTDKVNLVKKDNSFTFEYFRTKKENGEYPENVLNFSYNSFPYTFFFPPNRDEENTNNPGEFLQTIEFKVV